MCFSCLQEGWWSNLAAEIQAAADAINTKQMYCLLRQAFGPRSTKITSLRLDDGTKLLTDVDDIYK